MCDTDWLCLLYNQITRMFHVYQIHSSDINVHWTTIPVDRHFKFVLKTSKTTRGIKKAGRLGQKKINKYASCVNRIDRQYTNSFSWKSLCLLFTC